MCRPRSVRVKPNPVHSDTCMLCAAPHTSQSRRPLTPQNHNTRREQKTPTTESPQSTAVLATACVHNTNTDREHRCASSAQPPPPSATRPSALCCTTAEPKSRDNHLHGTEPGTRVRDGVCAGQTGPQTATDRGRAAGRARGGACTAAPRRLRTEQTKTRELK